MNWLRPSIWTSVALMYGTISGCAGGNPIQFAEQSASVEGSLPPAPRLARAPASSGVGEVEKYNATLATMEDDKEEGSLSRATKALVSATESIKDSLTPKPKIVPARDPLALSEDKKVHPNVFFSLATVYEGRGMLAEAVEQYKKGLDADPDDVTGWIKFARMYDRHGDSRQSLSAYGRALQLEPGNAIVLNDMGLSQARRGEYEAALDSLRQAVAAKPEKNLYRNNLATVLVATGQYDEALEQLRAVHAPAAANYNLAILLLKQQRHFLAVRHLEGALASDPSFAPARELLNGIQRAESPGRRFATNPDAARTPTAAPRQPVPRHAVPQQPARNPQPVHSPDAGYSPDTQTDDIQIEYPNRPTSFQSGVPADQPRMLPAIGESALSR